MRTQNDPRHKARIMAFMYLYSIFFQENRFFFSNLEDSDIQNNRAQAISDLAALEDDSISSEELKLPENATKINEKIKSKFKKVKIKEFAFKNYSKKLYDSIIHGSIERKKDIDAIVNKYSNPIKTTDLDTVSLTAIRIAVYEGFIAGITPPKVAVDEAIELVKDFAADNRRKKVSGILGKVYDAHTA